jgi:mycofactocin system creatininase family protein
VGEARLASSTSPEVAGRRAVLLVPLGSTEQHGPHLPIGTDTSIAVALAAAAAALLAGDGVDVLVAPALAYGASGEHQGFAGTLSIGQDALESVVVELARSAGGDHALLVVVNGHGGNSGPLARAVATLAHEQRRVLAWSPRVPGGDSHAGRTETSLMLAIDPSTVRLDRAVAGVTTPLGELIDDLRAGGLAAVTANGVLGDPTGASADEGRRLLADLAADLVEAIRSTDAAPGVGSTDRAESEMPPA